jgi:hypothetical protein
VPVVSRATGSQKILADNASFQDYVTVLRQVRAGELPNSAFEPLIKDFEARQ